MRRLAPLPFLLLAILSLTPPAGAQPDVQVRVRLTDQHPFASPKHPLRLTVEATNAGPAPVRRLSMSVSLYHPATSRTELRRSLEADPVVAQILVFPLQVPGSLDPGQTRTFVVDRALPELTGRDENALYPMKVQLESDGLPVATLRSAVVFIRERPLIPLNVSVTLVLDEGMALRAGGAFADDRLERTLAPGGRLETVVEGLERAPVQATLAISPFLLEQLRRMSSGYRVTTGRTWREEGPDSLGARRAAAMLERLQTLARDPDVEILAMPLTAPSIPALVDAGLGRDLRTQLDQGRQMVDDLLPGANSLGSLLRPPGSLLTPRAVRELARAGVEGLVLDADTLRPGAATTLTGPAVASVPAGRRRRVRAVVPDTAAMDLALEAAGDPALQAQKVIAELSAIYFEGPGTDRGVALVLGEGRTPDPRVMDGLLLQLRRSSPGVTPRGWLRPVKASRLIAGPGTVRRALAPRRAASYGSAFRNELRAARDGLAELSSMARETAPLVAKLRLQVLVAEAREFADRQALGIAFLQAVQRRVGRELDKVQPPARNSAITLTSRRGVIPVTISSTADYPVHLRVTLLSPRLRFPEGSTRRVVLDRPRQALTFPVLAQTTGRFPVRVVIATPTGAPIAESRIVVRSTAYNTRALLVTGVATVFLLFLWVRRLLSTRT